MKIYKEIVHPNNFDSWITVPGFRIVSVGATQDGNLCFWYTTGDEQPDMKFQYKVVGTGWEFEGDCIVVGSAIIGPFVWHVLERRYHEK